jgi:kynurenine formamidase
VTQEQTSEGAEAIIAGQAAAGRCGALAYVDSGTVMQALALARHGELVSLNRSLADPPDPLINRPGLRRTMRLHNQIKPLPTGRSIVINDDSAEFPLQGSSHWDSLAHFGCIEEGHDGVFYGGLGLETTSPEPIAKELGIETFQPGLLSRGVLLDIVDALGFNAPGYLPAGFRIETVHVEEALEKEGVQLRRGDVVLIFTGYEKYARSSPVHRDHVAGLSSDTLSFWADARVAALAADNPAVEVMPMDYGLHIGALRDLGLPLGELWALETLRLTCIRHKRFEFVLVSVPLNIPGAFGSPANAIAVF